MKKTVGFIITAGHLDIEWYQPLRSYRFWTVEALEILRDKASKRKDFKTYVLDGQVFPLEEYLEVVPEDLETMKQLIADGKLTIGPFYTQFDEWIPSAENIIRNCLYGRRKSDAFGGYMRAGFLPDNFGHPFQLPQILQNFGIDSLMFTRGMPEIPGDHPDEFLYEGIDGTSVMASHFRESYFGAFDIFNKVIEPHVPREVPYYNEYLSYEYHKDLAFHDDPVRIAANLVENVKIIKERYPSGIIPLIAGYDHLPPQVNIGDSVKCANEMQDEIEFVMGDAQEYAELVRSRWKNPAVYRMELTGSRYQHILLGALSTRTYLKRENFGCEALMERYAEPLVAIANTFGYHDKPLLMDEAWKYMMMNSAHDSIHGSSTDETHAEMEMRFAAVRQIAAGVIHDAMAFLGRKTERWWGEGRKVADYIPVDPDVVHKGGDRPFPLTNKGILTFTTVSSEKPQAAEAWLPIGDEQVTIQTQDGKVLPTQVLEREKVEKNALGQIRNHLFPYPVYRKVLFTGIFSSGQVENFGVFPGNSIGMKKLTADEHSLENEYLKVVVHGSLVDIYDKGNRRWFRNMNLLVEEADAGDAWDYSPAWVQGKIVHSTDGEFSCSLKEQGSVRAVLEVKGSIQVPEKLEGDYRSREEIEIPIKFEISLYRQIKRVDVRLTLDNRAKDHRIRLKITPNLVTDKILSQGHLAVLERPVERVKENEKWYQPPTQLLPFREWLAAEDENVGLAVACKGMYDYEAIKNPLTREPEIYITLVRGVGLMGRLNTMQRKRAASEAIPIPEAQCLGEQVMEWCFLPYQVQPDEKAPFAAEAQSFLYPPAVHVIRSEEEDIANVQEQFFSWKEKNIQFSAFKNAIDGGRRILRFFENQGKATRTKIELGNAKQVWLSNMNEELLEELTLKEGCVCVDLKPYQAMTIAIR